VTIRQDNFAFPLSPNVTNGISLGDFYVGTVAYQSAWTAGNTTIGYPPVSSQINQKWTLQAIGIGGLLARINTQGAIFGKLGKIVGGLLLPTTPINTLAYALDTLLPLPNPALTFDVWNPAIDALPPEYDVQSGSLLVPPTPPAVNQALAIDGQLQLPTPLELDPGQSPAIGLWMLPSLVGSSFLVGGVPGWNYKMAIYNATYSLTYDDGAS